MRSIRPFFDKVRRHAFKAAVVKRAMIMSLVVGAILIAINHGDKICDGTYCLTSVFKSLMTMLVPYTVSTMSSVMAIEETI